MRRSVVVPAGTTPQPSKAPRKHKRRDDPSGPLFVLGFFVLFLINAPWSSFLALIGVTSFIKHQSRDKARKAIRHLVFWCGVAFLFWTNSFFPGVLFLFFLLWLLKRS